MVEWPSVFVEKIFNHENFETHERDGGESWRGNASLNDEKIVELEEFTRNDKIEVNK